MTTKEASKKFKIEIKEIGKRYRDEMIINAYKENGKIVIPEETTIIPSKQEIKAFLFQLLKLKNNYNITINRSLCPTAESVYVLTEYLYQKGLIGQYQFNADIKDMFRNISLTDEGITYVLGKDFVSKYNNYKFEILNININPSFNFGINNSL